MSRMNLAMPTYDGYQDEAEPIWKWNAPGFFQQMVIFFSS